MARNNLTGTLVLCLALSLSCASQQPRDCTAPFLSRQDIIGVVREEIKRRGGDPSSIERSKIKIKRDGCDYIYHQVYRPKRPGGYLFVKVNEAGKILDWFPGL